MPQLKNCSIRHTSLCVLTPLVLNNFRCRPKPVGPLTIRLRVCAVFPQASFRARHRSSSSAEAACEKCRSRRTPTVRTGHASAFLFTFLLFLIPFVIFALLFSIPSYGQIVYCKLRPGGDLQQQALLLPSPSSVWFGPCLLIARILQPSFLSSRRLASGGCLIGYQVHLF